jgi:hypothetical protein
LFGILNFGHCDLPFDFAQDREPVEQLVEPFGICHLKFFNPETLYEATFQKLELVLF